MADLQTQPPRYGTLNLDYIATWGEIPDKSPMWALNLMHYRAVADYRDGRESTISGQEADDRYAPFEPLAAVGASLVLVAPVVTQLDGDDTTWDRIAIVRYPNRRAMIEMERSPEFQKQHIHKEAGMASTIVAATYPQPGTVHAATGIRDDDLLLLQVVADAATPDVATAGCTALARFDVDAVVIGDGRTWAEARWHVLPVVELDTVRDAVTAQPSAADRYVIAMRPFINEFASALTSSS
jgi:uncharacterized protein (DUF1330 family)